MRMRTDHCSELPYGTLNKCATIACKFEQGPSSTLNSASLALDSRLVQPKLQHYGRLKPGSGDTDRKAAMPASGFGKRVIECQSLASSFGGEWVHDEENHAVSAVSS